MRLRLVADDETVGDPFGERRSTTSFAASKAEADEFYDSRALRTNATAEERRVVRQAYAGLLWTKQFYHYVVKNWLDGDPAQPTPPPSA